MTGPLFLGIDVGTGSARAGLFDDTGRMLASAKHDICMWREAGSIVEQSSDDIWQAVCASVRGALAKAEVAPSAVAGIGFPADQRVARPVDKLARFDHEIRDHMAHGAFHRDDCGRNWLPDD